MEQRMNVLQLLLKIIDGLNAWTAKIISWALILIIASTVYEVFMRYVLSQPTDWSFAFNYLAHGIYFMLLGAFTMAQRGHVSVDIFYNRLSLRGRAIIDLVTAPVFFIFLAAMFWYGGVFALNSFGFRETLSSAWAPPIWPIKMIIPLAAGMMLMQGVAKFIRDSYIVVTGRELSS